MFNEWTEVPLHSPMLNVWSVVPWLSPMLNVWSVVPLPKRWQEGRNKLPVNEVQCMVSGTLAKKMAGRGEEPVTHVYCMVSSTLANNKQCLALSRRTMQFELNNAYKIVFLFLFSRKKR